MGVHPYTKSIVFTLNQTLPAAHSAAHPSNAAKPVAGPDPYTTYAIRVYARMLGVQRAAHASTASTGSGHGTPHTVNLLLYHRSSIANPLICDDGTESCSLYGYLTASPVPYELLLIHSGTTVYYCCCYCCCRCCCFGCRLTCARLCCDRQRMRKSLSSNCRSNHYGRRAR
jgi:hypothetical protein